MNNRDTFKHAVLVNLIRYAGENDAEWAEAITKTYYDPRPGDYAARDAVLEELSCISDF